MEVVVTEEKKKIFRARKTMKISDRQQLDSLHTTLLSAPTAASDASQPVMNGTHKEEEQKVADKELNNVSDSNSPGATVPPSPASQSSPAPLPSPTPVNSQSPKAKDDTSPTSPFHSLNIELKKMQEDEKEENEKKGSSKSQTNRTVTPPPSKETSAKDLKVKQEKGRKEAGQTTTKNSNVESTSDSAKGLVSSPTPGIDSSEPMEMDTKTDKDKDVDSSKEKEGKPSSPKSTTSDSLQSSRPSSHSASSSSTDLKQEKDLKKMGKKEEKRENEDARKGSTNDTKMDVDLVKLKIKTEKMETSQAGKSPRPSSTPPSDAADKEKVSSPGLKRTLSEGNENDEPATKRELKRAKVDREELEAELELKITAKAGSHHKLEKIVQQLVDKQLRALQVTIFDTHFKELKDRVDRIDCSVKHQTAINALQAKIARLAKKFGEANQATENKKKQEAVVAAAIVAKTATVPVTTQLQRPARTSVELKQASTTVSPSKTAATPIQPALPAPAAAAAPVPVSTAMVTQTPILQLITSTANAASTLATSITSQSPTGTLLLKTAPGSGMVASGQPLLIQLPLSMPNGPAGTLVNIPVSSLSAVSSLNKAKTTAATATFILKPASALTTAPASSPAVATVPALQASSGQMSVARVYQGGTGGITTPNAGISVTTARTPAQSVSVAGAMSSVSSPATSGPAATGSTAPGPPQGTSLTSKTDNQAAGSTPSKGSPAATRPKGSVIDLTEDDDDVQVTGVKKATVTTPSAGQRAHPVISISNTRSSPQTNQNSPGNPQLTVHHRPQVDSPLKSRASATTNPPAAAPSVTLPPLPPAPAPPRLSPEAERTSPPQQPQLKLMQSPSGIVLSWCVAETDRTCAAVDSYHLYAYHQDSSSGNAAQQHWKKIGEVKALPLPMACTLTQFQSGSTYHFAVRAKDIHGRFGSFCEPQCTNVISSSSS
ncbi:activating transcription factor 7-interacting protein 1 isoform X3 [Nelusetta ayraudi]|uniref:activating transcription factor 7-interacting protein 1 isoform X3 n=1 Tax=Nelusetta ayraudi TaxID=303726 RepID=UPI003F6E662D